MLFFEIWNTCKLWEVTIFLNNIFPSFILLRGKHAKLQEKLNCIHICVTFFVVVGLKIGDGITIICHAVKEGLVVVCLSWRIISRANCKSSSKVNVYHILKKYNSLSCGMNPLLLCIITTTIIDGWKRGICRNYYFFLLFFKMLIYVSNSVIFTKNSLHNLIISYFPLFPSIHSIFLSNFFL